MRSVRGLDQLYAEATAEGWAWKHSCAPHPGILIHGKFR